MPALTKALNNMRSFRVFQFLNIQKRLKKNYKKLLGFSLLITWQQEKKKMN
jgi:hypothetical protein